MIAHDEKTIVVIGNGMVGHRFCEKMVEFDQASQFRIVTFCEEPRAAYDRVGLTSFFAHRDAAKLRIARLEWYEEHGIKIHVGDRATRIDRGTTTGLLRIGDAASSMTTLFWRPDPIRSYPQSQVSSNAESLFIARLRTSKRSLNTALSQRDAP